MRVLQLHTRYRTPAGEDSVVDNEATALRAAGHDVRQSIVENPPGTRRAIGALARSAYNGPAARRVTAEIAEFDPDVVHVHNTWFALSSSAVDAAASSGVPVVMTLHNYRLGCISVDLFRDGRVCTACVARSPLRGVLHGCYRDSRLQSAVHATEVAITRRRGALERGVDRFVAPSQFMADRLVDIGVPADRLVVKPHFTDDPGPRPSRPSSSDEVVYVGRLAAGKGVDTLVDAWRRVERDLRLTIIGDGPMAADVGRVAGSDVDLVGWLSRSAVTERLLRARALVMPSEWYEPFGMVLIEAMSAGLPIIVTSVSGARSIVASPDGLVVPPRSPDALAAAITTLDDHTVDEIGEANRSRFEESYTHQTGVATLEALYRSVIAERRG